MKTKPEKIVMVVGVGPNDLQIPLLIFKTKLEAKSYLENKLNLKSNDDGIYDVFDRLNEWDEENFDEKLVNGLFKDGNYYGGCGECDSLIIEEIEFSKPLVGWDLD